MATGSDPGLVMMGNEVAETMRRKNAKARRERGEEKVSGSPIFVQNGFAILVRMLMWDE